MPLLTLDKVLKILQIVLSLLQMALKAFTGLDKDDPDKEGDE